MSVIRVKSEHYVCDYRCGSVFVHPDNNEDCECVDGVCEHLSRAGWKPITVRLETRTRALLLVRGGWACADCAKANRL